MKSVPRDIKSLSGQGGIVDDSTRHTRDRTEPMTDHRLPLIDSACSGSPATPADALAELETALDPADRNTTRPA
jgi:hypothetical protein